MVEPTPGLYQEIELKHIKVVIVGSREQFRSAKASQPESRIMGYANSANEIWIFGKEVNGQIIVNEAILGHELMHLLGFENPIIANPDQFQQNDQLQANFAGLLK